jgi:PAS domain S-box-containing protein
MESETALGLQWFANTGSGVWAVDASQRIVFWNQAAEELLGFTADQALGRLCYQLLAGQNTQGQLFCQAECHRIQRARQHDPVQGFEMLVQGQDRELSRIGVSIVVIPVGAQDNTPAALVHIFRPIGKAPAMLPLLRIQLLGNTNIWRADGTLVDGPDWRKRKVQILLAFLALQRGRLAHREALLEALWPDLEYTAALHNLHTTVYHLRKSLEPTLQHGSDSRYVRYEGNCYCLDVEASLWLDVVAFETGIAQARRELGPEQAINFYRNALSWYQGDFLADLGTATAWCSRERERLRDLYLEALEKVGRLHEQRREYKQANEMYWKALSADPCHESACQRLMQLAALREDRTAIVALYNSLVAALDREVGARPTQETVSIYEAARRGV